MGFFEEYETRFLLPQYSNPLALVQLIGRSPILGKEGRRKRLLYTLLITRILFQRLNTNKQMSGHFFFRGEEQNRTEHNRTQASCA